MSPTPRDPSPSSTIGHPTLTRRAAITAGALWSAPAVVTVCAAPAFAASTRPRDYVALFDTQSANTNQNNTDASTWPHGLITDADPSKKTVRFTLGMQMMPYNNAVYQIPFDTYKNWTSGPITVNLTFDNTVYRLMDSQSTWRDQPDNGGSAWKWTSTSVSGTQTTLTFTHDEIAMNGNTLGMPTQTGAFSVLFTLLKNPGVQKPPAIQPAGGRTVTNSMSISVSSQLPTARTNYVQEDSSQLF